MTISRVATVFVGGGLGACARALVLQILSPWNAGLHLPVLLVNLIGSFLIGVVFVLADEAELMSATTRLFLAVGVLGGFTTFGTFGWGADSLIGGGRPVMAATYVVASTVGALLAVVGGVETGREIVRAANHMTRSADTVGRRPRGELLSDQITVSATDDREDGELA